MKGTVGSHQSSSILKLANLNICFIRDENKYKELFMVRSCRMSIKVLADEIRTDMIQIDVFVGLLKSFGNSLLCC